MDWLGTIASDVAIGVIHVLLFAEAEALPATAHKPCHPDRVTQFWYRLLLVRCDDLYDRWNRPDQTAIWRERLRVPGGDQYRCP